MPEICPQGYTEAPEACITWNLFDRDNFPCSDPDTRAWNLTRRITQRIVPDNYRITQEVTSEDLRSHESSWTENSDSFTQYDLLSNVEEQLQNLIFQIRNSTLITYREGLANRLLALLRDAKEDDSNSIGISVDSLRKFYNFIRLHTNLKIPVITLTPDYNIYASWRGEHNQLLSVHFLPSGDARFVIFKPNRRQPDKKIRLSGIATIDTLMDTITPNSVSDWILE